MADTHVLEIHGLSKNFGGTVAIDDFNAQVRSGQIVGIIGPNGAGKTTIINTVSRIVRQDKGSVYFDGKCLDRMPMWKIARQGIGRTFQNIRLFSSLTVQENVMLVLKERYGKLSEKEQREKSAQLMRDFGWSGSLEAHPGGLPYGTKRKLELIRAMALDPKLLMLDEPAAGMNPVEIQELISYIREIREKHNLAIVVIEHRMEVIRGLCDHVYVQASGKTIAQGTSASVISDPRVIEAYLGDKRL